MLLCTIWSRNESALPQKKYTRYKLPKLLNGKSPLTPFWGCYLLKRASGPRDIMGMVKYLNGNSCPSTGGPCPAFFNIEKGFLIARVCVCSDGPGFFFPYSVFTLFFFRVVLLVKWHKGKLSYISFATLGREIKKKKKKKHRNSQW